MQLFTREQILFARRVHVQSERAVKTRLKGEGERKVSIELFSFRHLLNLISELPPAPDRGVMGGGGGTGRGGRAGDADRYQPKTMMNASERQ